MKIEFREKPYHSYWKVYDDGTPEEKVVSVTKITGLRNKDFLVGAAVKVTAEFLIARMKDVSLGKFAYTELMLDELLWKAKKEYRRQWDEAALHGTDTHKAIETYLLTGKRPKCPIPAVEKALDNFMAITDAQKMERVLGVEQIVYSATYDYAGTADLIAVFDGKVGLRDTKTSNDFDDETMPQQLSAYSDPWDDANPDKKIETMGVFRFEKRQDKPNLGYWRDYTTQRETGMQGFLTLLQYYQTYKEENNGGK